MQNILRPAASFPPFCQLHTARKARASHQLVHATQDRQDLPLQAQPVVRPLSQTTATQQFAEPKYRGKPKGSGQHAGGSIGPTLKGDSAWSHAATIEPCLQLLSQGQVAAALEMVQELSIQHGPPDKAVGDTILLVRPPSTLLTKPWIFFVFVTRSSS